MRITFALLVILLLSGTVIYSEGDEPKPESEEAKPSPSAEEAGRMQALIDTDSDGKATFEEFKAKQLEYYLAAKKLKRKKEKFAKLKEDHKELLTTQQFLAADKDNDEVVSVDEIAFLLDNPRHELDLNEADLDLMVEDWLLRYKKKCPNLYYTDDWHGSKVQKGYKHLKRELSKDELRARPFREAVIKGILSARRRDSLAREFTWAQWSSGYAVDGLEFNFGGKTFIFTDKKGVKGKTVLKLKSKTEKDGRDEINFKDSGLKFEYTADNRTGDSTAGKFDCRYIEIRFGKHVLKTWRLKKHPFIPVVMTQVLYGDDKTATLKSYTEPE
ncbi:MAG: hypothetical protein L3J82_05205 [Planctomycetes bacterium]|nr:hypothetical protein [Planctomycetota bacterium]